MGNLPPSHLHSASGIIGTKKKFRFRWWMPIILVGIIVIVGIIVLRFSHASAIPPEELAKIQSGITVDTGVTGATVKYAPYNYERHFNLVESVRAQQDPAEYNKLLDLVMADLEAIYIKNNATNPSPTPTPASTPPTSPTTTGTQNAQTPSTTDTPTQPQADTSGNTAQNTQTAPTTATNQNQDSTTPRDLGTVSGYVTLNYNTQGEKAITSIGLLVDNKMLEVKNKAPYGFSFDSRQFSNGPHTIKAVITRSDNLTEQHYYTANFNNSTFFDKYVYPIGAPWRLLFRW